MVTKLCSDCGRLAQANRCTDCKAKRDRAREAQRDRGTTTQRGYGAAYQRARNAAVSKATHCSTCGDVFSADNPPTGGHRVNVRDGGTVSDGIDPQCRTCNYGEPRRAKRRGGSNLR